MASQINSDIAIIGGGLSGLSLSIQLAKLGYKVVLIEKKDYPRHKVCGEYISLESWEFVKNLGIDLESLDLPIINELHLSSHKNQSLTSSLPLGGFGLSRFMLEQKLVELARQNDVRVLTKETVTQYSNTELELQSGKRILTRLTVAAFGKKTNFNLRVKPSTGQKYFALKWHLKSDVPKNRINLHFFEKGYIGSSQVENGITNACLMASAEVFEKAGGNIDRFMKEVVFKNKDAKAVFDKAEPVFERPLSIGNITFSHRYPEHEQWLFCGDAAGMVAPLSGNGMSMAFLSAKLLCKHIHQNWNEQNAYQKIKTGYKNDWNKHFRTRLFVGNWLQQGSLNDFAVPVIIRLGQFSPKLLSSLIKKTHGEPF
ncbi:NAD(P)/FAD-dependent oxidoreductase [Jiulongibacter sp. NS-SX5]|uniref:NAD(P)/FAD-dependent oxidoreductase n=1 Tax=Jiulongibacter sp. NS-SX5 TaxID=3463854 RepID=UPI0040599A03